ncbi:DUF983 domain-containing protein [Zavarzinia sp. CC-PAN008]|uniref:DUF983 domain-containing protein n=1 Tax=Zavarzinia sp. CC-PAN008 TaxID=3243332 RepID=UPI003F74AA83
MPIETIAAPRPLPTAAEPDRPVWQSMMRGAALRCPACGYGRMFRAYLKVADECTACGEELHHHRADDAPPYFTITIIGHILLPLIWWSSTTIAAPPLWFWSFWVVAIIASCLVTLPVIKGALVGLQWSRRMHGFSGLPDSEHRM